MRTWIAISTLALGLAAVGCGPGNTQRLLREAVESRKDTLDDCYEQALKRDENIAGTVQAKLHVEAKTGKVQKAAILGGAGDASMHTCMKDVLSGIRIDEPAKVDVTVDYEFELVPDGEGGGTVVEN